MNQQEQAVTNEPQAGRTNQDPSLEFTRQTEQTGTNEGDPA